MATPGVTEQLNGLLLRVATGDEEAFADWYDATSAMVFGLVLRVLRDRAQAEEVTQEVYVEAWRLAARFDARRGSAMAWLNTIAHRRAVDRVRTVERAACRERRSVERAADVPEPDASEVVVLREEGRRVRRAMTRLSDVQREAIELAYFEGRTHREVAQVLDIPLGTAKTRIRDALGRLRAEMEEATR